MYKDMIFAAAFKVYCDNVSAADSILISARRKTKGLCLENSRTSIRYSATLN